MMREPPKTAPIEKAKIRLRRSQDIDRRLPPVVWGVPSTETIRSSAIN